MKKAVIYINQFFAGIGGEEFADHKPEIREGLIGPALAVNTVLKNAEITHTIICGDNYMGSNTEDAIAQINEMLEGLEFDIFFAGPAFQAGRYGVACGTICKSVKEKFNVEVITSMHAENPGVDMFKKDMYIFSGGKSAAAMRKDAKKMAALGDKILDGETAFLADEFGFFKRGIRYQVWLEDGKPAADRAIEMLLKKVNGEPFVTELPIPKVDRVPIAAPVTDLSKVRVALVTTGGIVPVENPDRIQSASATRWGRYDIGNMERLEGGVFKTIHAGYDPAAADADPNVCVPVDAVRDYEKQGVIGKLDDYFYTTVGTGTTEAEAQRMAKEMIPFMKQDGVDAIIMTST
ncbi:glycine reductase [Dethiosulfatibacter aminovorans DSM 17477]|nr:glycine reductase [Dethiosulfatibacter aminovorans DSM 17477]